jgi:hypothetical protein
VAIAAPRAARLPPAAAPSQFRVDCLDNRHTLVTDAGDDRDGPQEARRVVVWIYEVTDKGLALELTAKGTKYYKDADLN